MAENLSAADYEVPSRITQPGVGLTIWTIVLFAVPPLLVLAIVSNPPREFGIVLVSGALSLWIPALIVAIILIGLAARPWQRVVGIVAVSAIVIGFPLITLLA